MRRLSSGSRINAGSDDPAGLVISEQMRTQIGSAAQKMRNMDILISRNNTADSYLVQMEERLLEMREIAVAATSTGYIDERMIDAYENELNGIASTFNGIATDAAFGMKELLDGSDGSVADVKEIEEFDLSDQESAEISIGVIDERLSEIHEVREELGAVTSALLESSRNSLEMSHRNLVESESGIRDADMAKEQTALTLQLLGVHFGTAILSHGNLVAANVFGLVSGR
jgi:flagellin